MSKKEFTKKYFDDAPPLGISHPGVVKFIEELK